MLYIRSQPSQITEKGDEFVHPVGQVYHGQRVDVYSYISDDHSAMMSGGQGDTMGVYGVHNELLRRGFRLVVSAVHESYNRSVAPLVHFK